MERLTIEKCGELLIKNNDDEYKSPCFGCESIDKCNPEKLSCGFYKALEKLKEYEDLEERLQNIYGECSGLLEKVIEHLEQHEGIELPESVFKAILLTDGEVDKWKEYKVLEEQGKLLKLPCKIGYMVYEIYQFMGEGAWEIDVHKIKLEDLENIGKTVFFTQEEAEAALEKGDLF